MAKIIPDAQSSFFRMKALPSDVRKFILKEQLNAKIDKGVNSFSMERTIYKLLREHPRFTNQ